jgi:uncharacterized membrane protein
MGTPLTGLEIRDTYDALIKITDNGPIGATAKLLSDGLGNDSVLTLSTTSVGVGGDTSGTVSGVTINAKFCVKSEGTVSGAGFVYANDTTAANGSVIYACRSRGTIASPTAVVSGDRLASLIFAGNDGTDLALAAQINIEADGTVGANDMPGRITFLTTPDGTQAPTEKMRIANDGKLKFNSYGSGTITGTAAYNLGVDASGNVIELPGGVIDGAGTANYVPKWTDANTLGNSQLFDNGTNVGIGTATPATSLQVGGTVTSGVISVADGKFDIKRSSDGLSVANFDIDAANSIARLSTAYSFLTFNTESVERVRITGVGNVGIGTSTPASLLNLAKSTNSGSGATFPRLIIANTLATQGDGASTFNFADLNVSSGDGAVNMFVGTTYAAGTWAPSGFLNVVTDHPLIIKTNNTERMRITNAGNLGIGTDAPFYKLQSNVQSTTNIVAAGFVNASTANNTTKASSISLLLSDTVGNLKDAAYLRGFAGDSNVLTGGLAIDVRATDSTPTEVARFTPSGNVGIGTSAPDAKLDVNGNLKVYNVAAGSTSLFLNSADTGSTTLNFGGTTNPTKGRISYSDFSDVLIFSTNSTERVRIDSSGNVGIGTTAPNRTTEIVGGSGATLGVSTSGSGSGILYGRLAMYSTFGSNTFIDYGGEIRSYSGAGIDYSDLRFYTAAGAASDEKLRITSAGNVGIGTTSPVQKLAVDGNIILQSSDVATKSLRFQSPNSNWGPQPSRIDFIPADGVNAAVDIAINLWNGSGANVETLRFPSSGGIQFPATQISSANANTLDDYEEGTFSPTVAGSSSAGTATYGSQVGKYTKVGNMVSIMIDIAWSSGTGTGVLYIASLPFANTFVNNAVSIGYLDGISLTASNIAQGYVAPSSTRIEIVQTPVGGGAVSSVSYDDAGRVILTATYFVS